MTTPSDRHLLANIRANIRIDADRFHKFDAEWHLDGDEVVSGTYINRRVPGSAGWWAQTESFLLDVQKSRDLLPFDVSHIAYADLKMETVLYQSWGTKGLYQVIFDCSINLVATHPPDQEVGEELGSA